VFKSQASVRQVSEHPASHAASYGTGSCTDNLYRLPFPSPTLASITNIVWLTHFNDKYIELSQTAILFQRSILEDYTFLFSVFSL
jgi:hypothetical protein